MAYITIPDADIQVGRPLKQSIFQKIKDNFDSIQGNVATAIESAMVQNGSFEIDSNEDGIPDGWTKTLYSGGAGAFYTLDPGHGAKGYHFTNVTGAGGGYISTNEYIPCTEFRPLSYRMLMKNSGAGVYSIGELWWYSASKSFVTSTQIFAHNASLPTWTEFAIGVVPPANARYFRLYLFGAHSIGTTGTTYYDMISVNERRQEVLFAYSGTNVGWNQSVTSLNIGGLAVAYPDTVGAWDTCSLSVSAAGVAGNQTMSITLTGISSGVTSIALPNGLWTLAAYASWRNGDYEDAAGNWRTTVIAIREA